MDRFADIILPLAAPGTFTYALPKALQGKDLAGRRVIVGFGQGARLYTGIVVRVHGTDPGLKAVRTVSECLDEAPVTTPAQLALWAAMAEHYMCTIGEVMVAALPGGMVLSSATKLIAMPNAATVVEGDLRLALLLEVLERKHELSVAEAGELLGLKDPMPLVRRLVAAGVVAIAEEMGKAIAPRTTTMVRLTAGNANDAALNDWFDRLERAPKRLAVLMRFVEMARPFSDTPVDVPKQALLRAAEARPEHLKAMVEAGLFETYEVRADQMTPEVGTAPKALSPAQQDALAQVRTQLETLRTVLLHGVTASGKTELYLELMAERVEKGEQVLYLLPEIALTTQVLARVKARFGDRVGVYHSRLSARERVELWTTLVERPDRYTVIVGARSALMLPFTKLGLVVVDEEHDPSFKQIDPAPRYHARDMAIVLSGIHGGRTVLGSATPSLESMHNARSGKYGFAALNERHGGAVLPKVTLVDLRSERKKKRLNGNFSRTLLEHISATVARKEQVILFQNRRGYSPVWQCTTCAWVPECDHCDVSLTYHKQEHSLRCHYCARNYRPPAQCSACGSARLNMIGFGTEKLEEELANIMPELRIARLDQDSTRGKHAFDRLLDRFGSGDVDVLIGTQMVTKGLDFGQVTLVGVMNADAMLHYPDLRAHERAFQLMAQVAGRSGRRRDPGTVLIQASDVEHPILQLVLRHDTEGMFDRELPLRAAHAYPPFSRLVAITLKHRDAQRVEATARALVEACRPVFGDRVLGPDVPAVARVRDLYIRNVLLKLDKGRYRAEKGQLAAVIGSLRTHEDHKAVRIVVDVDPA